MTNKKKRNGKAYRLHDEVQQDRDREGARQMGMNIPPGMVPLPVAVTKEHAQLIAMMCQHMQCPTPAELFALMSSLFAELCEKHSKGDERFNVMWNEGKPTLSTIVLASAVVKS